MFRHNLKIALISGALGILAMQAQAKDAVWAIAGKEVLTIRANVSGRTPEHRVDLLDERLTEILSSGEGKLGAQDIIIKRDKGTISITVCSKLMITVADEDAKANKTTREKLAHVWLTNMRRTLPQLAPKENRGGA